MDDRFFHGLIGSQTRVCHYNLDALTPWHLVLLSAIESPIIEPDKDCNVNDLLVCLKILQLQWPELPDLKSSTRDKWAAFRMRLHREARKEFEKFTEWLKVQMSFPEFWEKDGESNTTVDTSNMPSVLSLIAGIVCNSNITLQQAWNMRVSEAQWYQAAIAYNNGAEFKLVDKSEPMPELGEVDPNEAVEEAKRTMPPELFARWHAAFKDNQAK